MKLIALAAMIAGLAAAAPMTFECLTPGAANQAVCAPVAGHITTDWQAPLFTLTYDAHNGTIAEEITLTFASAATLAFDIFVHSNGGQWSQALPEMPTGVLLSVRGIGGPDQNTLFSADCPESHVPEPRGTAGAGVLMIAAAAGLALRWRR